MQVIYPILVWSQRVGYAISTQALAGCPSCHIANRRQYILYVSATIHSTFSDLLLMPTLSHCLLRLSVDSGSPQSLLPIPGFFLIWDTFFNRPFDDPLGGAFVRAWTGVVWLELWNTPRSSASSSADVSDSGRAGSFDESDTRLWVDESSPGISAFSAFAFAAAMEALRFASIYSLPFLHAPAPCRKLSGFPVIA